MTDRHASDASVKLPKGLSPGSWARSFSPSSLPMMQRSNYRWELLASFFLPFLLAAVEGGVLAVIVRNAFEGVVSDTALNYAVGLIAAAPAFANIISFVWARLGHGREKLKLINRLQVGLIAGLVVIALSPQTPLGLLLLLGGAVWARMCHSGVVTLRSQVWAMNYPRAHRAQISGRFATVGILIIAVVGTALGLLMTVTSQLVVFAPAVNQAAGLPGWANTLALAFADQAYRVLLPAFGIIGAVGIALLSRVRVRGERASIVEERASGAAARPPMNPWRLIGICFEDKRYGMFMLWQFFLGSGNMMAMAVLVITLRERFAMGYEAVLITHAVPLFCMTFAIPFWARYLDRENIIRFRAVHSWVFVAMFSLMVLGVAVANIWIVALASVIRGIAFGGGALAWNLGHHDLAPKDRASQYMAVHVTLTGVRGLLMPVLGVTLYEGYKQLGWEPSTLVFGICLGFVLIGTLGFVRMDRARTSCAGVVEATAPGVAPVVVTPDVSPETDDEPVEQAHASSQPGPSADDPEPSRPTAGSGSA